MSVVKINAISVPEGAGDVVLLEVPAMAISSTDCRARVRSGQPVWYLVPDGVVQYIGKYGLYRPGDDHRWPADTLGTA